MTQDYLYLRAWDNMMGSNPSWCQLNLERARKEKAPHDAIFKDSKGNWQTFKTIERPDTKILIEKFVEAQLKE